jgi:hypothetical protein
MSKFTVLVLPEVFPLESNLPYTVCRDSPKIGNLIYQVTYVRAALHLEAGPIRHVKGLKSSLVDWPKGSNRSQSFYT